MIAGSTARRRRRITGLEIGTGNNYEGSLTAPFIVPVFCTVSQIVTRNAHDTKRTY